MSLLSNVFHPIVADERGFRRYVWSVTLLSWTIALGADVANQLVFFSSWADCAREWSITAVVVIAIAVPIARSMGRAHLELHHAKKEADRLGRTDPLTGLANRRAFYEAADSMKGGLVALVIADIDRFKSVNDRFGHAAGDEVIKAVAKLMADQLGDIGVVARVGGEEFALVCAGRNVADVRARLLLFRERAAGQTVRFGERLLSATVSIGFAARRNADFDQLYAAADKALYAAKAAGRDRMVDYDQIETLAPGVNLDWRQAG